MLSPLDEELIKLASQHKSPREIGKQLNIPADEALIRINEILDSRDVYDARQLFLMYLDDLYELKNMLQADVKNYRDPKAVTNLIRVLEQLGKALENANENNQKIASELTVKQSDFMVQMIVSAFEYAQKRFTDVRWEDITPVFREGLILEASRD